MKLPARVLIMLATVVLSTAACCQEVASWGGDPRCALNTAPTSATHVMAIACGGDHNLVLRTDGTVVAWGCSDYGQTTVPASASTVVAVAAGRYHSLALKADGRVVAWGRNNYGQTTVPSTATNVVAIGAGRDHNLAVKADGTVVAWGCNDYGQATVPASATNLVAVAGGGDHSLALKADGTVVAWGRNNSGQTTVPFGAADSVAIVAGDAHSLALKADGTVVAWGDNSSDQANVPFGLSNVAAIAAAGWYSLALKSEGVPVSWGSPPGGFGVPSGLSKIVAVASGGCSMVHYGDGRPWITVQPWGRPVSPGSTVALKVMAAGDQPLSYQWQSNGVSLTNSASILGAKSKALTILSFQTNQAANYTVIVANTLGSATSQVARVTVYVLPPRILVPPGDRSVHVGTSVTFSAVVDGSPPFSYQWLFNLTNIIAEGTASSHTLTYTIPYVQPANAGDYVLVVNNSAGSTSTPPAKLAVGTLWLDVLGVPTGGVLPLRLCGDVSRIYEIQVSTDLSIWSPLTVLSNATGTVDFIDPAASGPRRFYWARRVTTALRDDGEP